MNPPKQKQPLFHKKIIPNTFTDSPVPQNVLPSDINDKKQQKFINLNKDLLKMEELTPHEKQIVSETTIFLKRNLRRIKEKRESKDKNNNQQKQHVDEQPLPLFFSQNYYHPSDIINETNVFNKNLNLSHKGKYLFITKIMSINQRNDSHIVLTIWTAAQKRRIEHD